jgi:holo-[acyl-carrier protein] synthase
VIVGLGTDIVEVRRIERMIERHGEAFLQRIFTPAEIGYCQQRRFASEPFAGRWAAKEAVMKVLGTGFIQGTHFQEIEILSEESGRPRVLLHGSTAALAKQLGIDQILVTMSHSREYATATAIGISMDTIHHTDTEVTEKES